MKSKLLKISGIMFAVFSISTVAFLFINVYNYIFYANVAVIGIKYVFKILQLIFFDVLPPVLISLYCFGLNKTKAGNIIYFIGFGVWALAQAYSIIQSFSDEYYSFGLSELMKLLVLLAFVYMIFIKIKSNKGIAVFGGILLVVNSLYLISNYVATSIIFLILSSSMVGSIIYIVLLGILVLSRDIALILLWLYESKIYFVSKGSSYSLAEK